MPVDFRRRLHVYFETIAPGYAQSIEPVFRPLVEALVEAARLRPSDRVLDLGAGTGLAARRAAGQSAFVAAADLSHSMLRVAHGLGAPNPVQADMHRLPLAEGSFDVALAVLAFNSTDPSLSMREALRVLRPGGRLHLQEWGTSDALSVLFDETLGGYAVEEPPPDLAAQREARFDYHPWDELETSEDIVAALRSAGFERISVAVTSPVVPLTDVRTFIRYKLAWPFRRAELDAMPGEVQALFLSDIEENLGALALPDGRLEWQPNLVRISAHKPG